MRCKVNYSVTIFRFVEGFKRKQKSFGFWFGLVFGGQEEERVFGVANYDTNFLFVR